MYEVAVFQGIHIFNSDDVTSCCRSEQLLNLLTNSMIGKYEIYCIFPLFFILMIFFN